MILRLLQFYRDGGKSKPFPRVLPSPLLRQRRSAGERLVQRNSSKCTNFRPWGIDLLNRGNVQHFICRSPRQRFPLMVKIARVALQVRTDRHRRTGRCGSGRRKIQCLPDPKSPGVNAGIRGQQGLELDATFPGDRVRRVARLNDIRARRNDVRQGSTVGC